MSHSDHIQGLRDDAGSANQSNGHRVTDGPQLTPAPALSLDHVAIMALRLQDQARAAATESNDSGSAAGDSARKPSRKSERRETEHSEAGLTSHEDALPPLSRQRIEDWLSNNGHYYFVDNDGDVGTILRHRIYFLRILGPRHDILQIRGCWNHSLDISHAGAARRFCNAYNRDTVIQKTYVRVDDTGQVSFFCETSVDLHFGLHERQLQNFINSGLGSGTSFFDRVDEEFAHLV